MNSSPPPWSLSAPPGSGCFRGRSAPPVHGIAVGVHIHVHPEPRRTLRRRPSRPTCPARTADPREPKQPARWDDVAQELVIRLYIPLCQDTDPARPRPIRTRQHPAPRARPPRARCPVHRTPRPRGTEGAVRRRTAALPSSPRFGPAHGVFRQARALTATARRQRPGKTDLVNSRDIGDDASTGAGRPRHKASRNAMITALRGALHCVPGEHGQPPSTAAERHREPMSNRPRISHRS